MRGPGTATKVIAGDCLGTHERGLPSPHQAPHPGGWLISWTQDANLHLMVACGAERPMRTAGRRNISEEQKSYLRGKRYNLEKQAHGGDRKSDASRYHSDILMLDSPDAAAGVMGFTP
jgi:hypothetical protein